MGVSPFRCFGLTGQLGKRQIAASMFGENARERVRVVDIDLLDELQLHVALEPRKQIVQILEVAV